MSKEKGENKTKKSCLWTPV